MEKTTKKINPQIEKMMEERRTGKWRLGLGMLDVIFAIVVLGIIGIGIYSKYVKTKTGADAKVFSEKVSTVIAAIESANTLNSQTYITSTTKKLSDTTLKLIIDNMGGATNTKDVQDWTYSCPLGSNKTLTVTTTQTSSIENRDLVIAGVKSNNYPWTATTGTGNSVVLTLKNIICR